MAQVDRTLQDALTSLPPAEVLAAARRFFARQNTIYAAYPDMAGPEFVSLRGAGNEEVVIAARSTDGATHVTASTYYFDMQVARFLSSLPAAGGAGSGLVETERVLPAAAEGAP